MTVQEIKQAVDYGLPVRWSNSLYHVIKDSFNQYLIVCQSNQYTIGLTWQDDKTLNGEPEEFYIQYKES